MYHCIYIALYESDIARKLKACNTELAFIKVRDLFIIYIEQASTQVSSLPANKLAEKAMAYQQLTKTLHTKFEGLPLPMDTSVETVEHITSKLNNSEDAIKAEIVRIKNTWEVSLYFELDRINEQDLVLPEPLLADSPGTKRMKQALINKRIFEAQEEKAASVKDLVSQNLKLDEKKVHHQLLTDQSKVVIHCHLDMEKIQLLRSNWISIKLSAKNKKARVSGPWPPFHFIKLLL